MIFMKIHAKQYDTGDVDNHYFDYIIDPQRILIIDFERKQLRYNVSRDSSYVEFMFSDEDFDDFIKRFKQQYVTL